MHDHEIELIAALVEGRLEDETEARALVASSPEHLEEYETQKLAFEALRSARTVSMSDTERAALHRDVWTALRAEEVAGSVRSPWYYRWAPVAAGLFVVVGVVAVLNQGGGDSEAEQAVAADRSSAPTSTAAESAEADGGGETALTQGGAATDTTAAASEDQAAPLAGDATDFYAREAEKIRRGDVTDDEFLTFEEEAAELQDCVDHSGLIDHSVVDASAPPSQDEETADSDYLRAGAAPYVAAAPEGVDLATATIVFVDRTECEVIVQFDE